MPLSRHRRAVVSVVAGALVATAVVAPVASATAAPATTAAPSVTTAAAPRTAVRSSSVRWVVWHKASVTAKKSSKSRTIARPDDGTRVRVLARGTYRAKVRVPSGKVGWVSKKAITSTPLRDISGTRYTKGRTEVTKTISGSSRVVKRAYLGTKVAKLARTTNRSVDRVKVRLPGGSTGWVSENRLTGNNVWGKLARCESGGNPRTRTGNGYYGLYQFTPRTWRSVGGKGLPHKHGAVEQTKRAQILQDRAGWGQWPACTRKLGLR